MKSSLFNKLLLPTLLLLNSLLFTTSTRAQNNDIPAINKLIADKQYAEARRLITEQVERFFNESTLDTITSYLVPLGELTAGEQNTDQAIQAVNQLLNRIKELKPGPVILQHAYFQAGNFFGYINRSKLAYDAVLKAYQYALERPQKDASHLATMDGDLGTYAFQMGNLDLSRMHQRRALAAYMALPNTDPETLYVVCNNMGSVMWNSSKTDSALYYFLEARKYLDKTERNPLNSYYRVAILENNLAAIYGLQGKSTESILTMKSTIENIKRFLASPEPHPKKKAAILFQCQATDNLGGIYKDLGDYKKTKELLEYSYQQKQATQEKGSPDIYKSQILLGQLYYAMRDYERAIRFLEDGLKGISTVAGQYLFWRADACYGLALVYDQIKQDDKADGYYETADSLYKISLGGDYDNIYLEFLGNSSLFYAENNQPEKAFRIAQNAYKYVVENASPESLLPFFQLLSLSQVYLRAGDARKAKKYSTEALEQVNNRIRKSTSLLDSIRMEAKKPRALLVNAEADYELMPEHSTVRLSSLKSTLEEALTVLERRKSVLQDNDDIALLMADHDDLLSFLKKITLELYQLTKDSSYAHRLIELHESGIYHRIRSRLDQQDTLHYAQVPAAVQAKEKQLKDAITASLQTQKSHQDKMQAYFTALQNWNNYQEQLRQQFPDYYRLRYESIFRSPGELRSSLPADASLVRYLYAGDELFVLVADQQEEKYFYLGKVALDDDIAYLSSPKASVEQTTAILYRLYQQIWEPFASQVRHKRVIILPDGILYHLSFELLTPKPIHTYSEIKTGSLLASYAISYHYSLFLVGQKNKQNFKGKNFVAFAPGFTDEVKAQYLARHDSITRDNGYLSLIPLPFTLDLARKTRQLVGGSAYLNENSTQSSFRNNAGDHKIIHIGTHAESNNKFPEFSRLIFAKNNQAETEDNSLFLFDIYNCNLRSDLTVLTACESGKPGYQDGEGMISLAHAFNYAGSQSILTGLWKIDEKASAHIMESFYANLLQGKTKDEALRQAKLSYLETAEGRTLAPAYWAGLMIMGNMDPIAIEPQFNGWRWVIILSMLLLLSAAFLWFRKRKQ